MKCISLLIIFSLLSCSAKNQHETNKPTYQVSADSVIDLALKGDTVFTKEGNYYQFIFSDSNNYKIKWGNKAKSFISSRSFELIAWGLILTESSSDAILLTQSCGTSCKEGVILTFNDTNNLKEYTLLRANDIRNDLVAYVPSEGSGLIIIENFVTGKSIKVDSVELCPAVFQGDCIDSLSFSNERFYIKWQGDKWTREKGDPREKLIDISLIISK
jgi:hypothetical protein